MPRFSSLVVVLPVIGLFSCSDKGDEPDGNGGGSATAGTGAAGSGGSGETGGLSNSGGMAGSLGGLGGMGGLNQGGAGGVPIDPAADSDGDTISDLEEGAPLRDTDGDGTPDYLDDDSDQDGIGDGFEAGDTDLATSPRDTDRDGTPDYIDLDSDGDGIPDATEVASGFDTDGDLTPDYLDTDSDNDDLSDGDEVKHGLDPRNRDSDDDGISDGDEGLKDVDDDGIANAVDEDSDGDGFSDAKEAGDHSVDTPPIDSDFDGVPDFLDPDSDDDGLPDDQEAECGRLDPDADGDGYSDLVEVLTGADPCDDGDTILDHGVEFYFVLPYKGDTQSATLRFVPRVQKADVFFDVDTTASMNGVIVSLKSGLSSIISDTRARVSDAAFGVASFEDFPASPFGNPGDEPFHLFSGITTSEATAQSAANALSLGAGGDIPEAGYEALYQAANGSGIFGAGGDFGPFSVSGRIGGAQFRRGALPIIVHATDAESHDTAVSSYPTTYAAHDHDDAFNALDKIGARVITIQNGTSPIAAASLTEISEYTRATVPPCSFKTSATAWRCGADKCCMPDATDPTTGADDQPECVLRFQIQGDGTGLADVTTDGIDAIIKYTKFDVYAAGRDDGDDGTPDTSAFLKKVLANEPDDTFKPPKEPEQSCNPVPTPAAFQGADYDNGFAGFAVGSSSASREGARLFFEVQARNTTVKETTDPQVFKAFIDIVDEQTGAVLDTQDVVVIVPGAPGVVGE